MVIQKFIDSIQREVLEWVGEDPVTIIGIMPDGVFYAKPLVEFLKSYCNSVEYAELDKEQLVSAKKQVMLKDEYGNDLNEEKLRKRKILMVDNDIVTGKTYKNSLNLIKSKQADLEIKEVKFAVFEDRLGAADFAYKIAETASIQKEYFDIVKRDLVELEKLKQKLVITWREVPPMYQGEMLAVLLSMARVWREWDRDGEINADRVMDWLRGSLHRAAYAYSEIEVPESLKTPEYRVLKGEFL